jgi:hypothetical protein
MNSGPVVDVCANCGAPLELDASGRCRWCHAHVRLDEPVGQPPASRPVASRPAASLDGGMGLVPDDADDCSKSAPFLYAMLGVLNWVLSPEPAVQQYVGSQAGLRDQIRALTAAVSAAGVRVRDAGVLKNDFDNNLVVYTPDEIWTFNLATDVIAVLSALDDLSADAQAKATSNLRSIDGEVVKHHWRKELKKANDGPAGFRELRARTPQHKARPAY